MWSEWKKGWKESKGSDGVREKEEGPRLYLISVKVSIEQKVQQAGSLVKP